MALTTVQAAASATKARMAAARRKGAGQSRKPTTRPKAGAGTPPPSYTPDRTNLKSLLPASSMTQAQLDAMHARKLPRMAKGGIIRAKAAPKKTAPRGRGKKR